MKAEKCGKLCKLEYEIGFLSGRLKALLDRLHFSEQADRVDADAFFEISHLHQQRNQCMREEIALLKEEANIQTSVARFKISEMEQRLQAQHSLFDTWQTNPMQESDRLFYMQALARLLAEEGVEMKEMLRLLKEILAFCQ